MANESSITLPDNVEQATKEYTALVLKVGLGLTTVFRNDSKDAFEKLSDLASDSKFDVVAVWAKTEKSISGVKAVLDRLPNGDHISYEEFGHRVVSVNQSDAVSVALSRVESQSNFELLRAFFCAAGTEICGF